MCLGALPARVPSSQGRGDVFSGGTSMGEPEPGGRRNGEAEARQTAGHGNSPEAVPSTNGQNQAKTAISRFSSRDIELSRQKRRRKGRYFRRQVLSNEYWMMRRRWQAGDSASRPMKYCQAPHRCRSRAGLSWCSERRLANRSRPIRVQIWAFSYDTVRRQRRTRRYFPHPKLMSGPSREL